MKKTAKKFIALFLVAMFIFAMATTAYASNGHAFSPRNERDKDTPYGTLTGALYVYSGAHTGNDYEMTACTSIASSNTMALTTTKMECMDSVTGESLEWDPSNPPQASVSNSNHCDLGHYHYATGSITVYTTHEVTYTNSYVLYMSTNL